MMLCPFFDGALLGLVRIQSHKGDFDRATLAKVSIGGNSATRGKDASVAVFGVHSRVDAQMVPSSRRILAQATRIGTE